jgi:hypothetical protein
MDIISPTYKFDRARFSRVATIYYLRRFWPIYALSLLTGAVFISMQRDGLGLWIGMIMIIYPFTVPIRYSMVMSARAAQMFDREMHYEFGETRLEIHNDIGGVTSAQLSSVRDVKVISDTLVLLFGRAGFLLLPLEIISAEQRAEVLKMAMNRGK